MLRSEKTEVENSNTNDPGYYYHQLHWRHKTPGFAFGELSKCHVFKIHPDVYLFAVAAYGRLVLTLVFTDH